MNFKQKACCVVIAAICWFPSISLAEVSDKIPPIQSILISGFLVGGGLFFIARFRWFLGLLLLPIPLVIITENYSLWNEKSMQEAILNEQGWAYFGALGIQSVLLFAGIITSIVFGYKAVSRKRR